jgi:NAD(P)-dependent dehydrogenase (short-subunit alcohol dehydrogenase family)
MDSTASGSVLLTGPTGGLGREAALALARRPDRPDLLLVGRAGRTTAVAEEARALGATVHEIAADLADLAQVRVAGERVRELLANGEARPLRAIVANAGLSGSDDRASADGYELTFAVNYLAHAQLVGDLLDVLAAPARVVLVGSNTYWQNGFRRMLRVAPSAWADPIELAAPAPSPTTIERAGVAYSNSKLALLYYAHELQRRAPDGVHVVVFEPGWMPGTGLARDAGESVSRALRAISRIPGVSTAEKSGPMLADVAVGDRWTDARDGAFVLKDHEIPVKPFAIDRDREVRLWEATAELLDRARG